MTSSGKSLTSFDLSPRINSAYRSKSVMTLPFRRNSMLRSDPWAEGPPLANSASTRVLNELTVYTPGRRACPVMYTCIDRIRPMSTERSKLRYILATAALKC